MKRRLLIIASISLQAAVLVHMAASRELIVLTGKTVFLRTAPVDPNDLFRGDYVSLNYDISEAPISEPPPADKKDRIYYTVLKEGEGEQGLYEFDYCSISKPDSGRIFIRGRDRNRNYYNHSPKGHVTLDYGIEKYFVQQKKGLDIEKRAGIGNAIHTPMEMEVALSGDGIAVLKGFRWSPVGIGLEITEASQPRRNDSNAGNSGQQSEEDKDLRTRKSPKIKLTLKNTSDKTLAIINLPDFRSFNVIPANPEKKWTFSKKFAEPLNPRNEDVIVLAPDQATSFDFDFADARWFVDGKNGPDEIGVVCNEWDDMFRIVYTPPSPEKCQDLDKKEKIWHGELLSRRFSTGRID